MRGSHARGNDSQGYFSDHIKMTRYPSLAKLRHHPHHYRLCLEAGNAPIYPG